MFLDKVQKGRPISAEEAKTLRSKGLIEGKRPNVYISSDVAVTMDQKTDYMKLKGADDAFCRKMILEYLARYHRGTRKDFDNMLIEKLPDVLDRTQKENRVKNMLQALKREGKIQVGPRKTWILT